MQAVHVDQGAALTGRLARVEITGATGSSLSGRAVEADEAVGLPEGAMA
jgi:hypothetical protein